MQAYEAIFEFCGERALECRQRSVLLRADDRKDEAAAEHIRENVFEIFRTVLLAAKKLHSDDKIAAGNFFMQKLEQIPSDWKRSLRLAQQHDDIEKARIERIKLEAVEEIRERLRDEAL